MSIRSLANIQVYFRFKGQASHAAGSPHLGRSALDAVELMNVGVNYLREHMPTECRVHYAVTNTGGISPNVVQANAEVLYLVRAPNVAQARALYGRVCKVAQGAALMTETELTIEIDKACSDTLPNATLELTLFDNLKAMGPVQFDDADRAYAEEIRKSFTEEHIRSSIDTYGADVPLTMPLHDGLVPFDGTALARSGSTDVGDVSWVTPTGHMMAATFPPGVPFHSWQSTACAGTTIGRKGMMVAAKALALSAVELFQNPELVKQARAAFEAKMAGQKYRSLIPENKRPALPPTP
jgi:aminobenzoyl-glutamate utilization protein B